MAKTSTQVDRVANVLKRSSSARGISATKLSTLAKVSKDNVYRIVYDLRKDKGMNIVVNYTRDKAGKRSAVYFPQ